jgi:adenylate kinase
MIIFLGVTGSGKSAQGQLLADEYGYAWISTGDILRVLTTGDRRREMLAGKLIDNDEMINIVSKIFGIVNPKQQMILDGFPRTIAQADWLIDQVKAGDFELTAIIYFEVSQPVVRDRLIKRGRSDDTEDSINRRFDEFNNLTMPIIKHFQEAGYRVDKIDASGDPQTIHQSVVKTLNQVAGIT